MPKEPEVKSLEDVSRPMRSHHLGGGDMASHRPLTLEKLERVRMERDRAGILFSNILRQVRGRVHKTEQLGTLDNTMMVYSSSHQ